MLSIRSLICEWPPKAINRMVLAESKTPTPVNITFAGENTCKLYIRGLYQVKSRDFYQTDATGNSGRKCVEDVHGRVQPLGQSLVAAVRFVKLSDLILKDGEYGVSRVAILQLRGERMGEKILFGLLLVGLERGLKDILEVRGS